MGKGRLYPVVDGWALFMKIEIQKLIKAGLGAGGEAKALALENDVSLTDVRKAINEGWPALDSLPFDATSSQVGGESDAGSASSPPAADKAVSKTVGRIQALIEQYNPKLDLRITARFLHMHVMANLVDKELKVADVRAMAPVLKDLLYIQQNTGSAKESDLEMIDKLQTLSESADPQGIIDLYIAMLSANQGVTNPDVVARDDPDPEALA